MGAKIIIFYELTHKMAETDGNGWIGRNGWTARRGEKNEQNSLPFGLRVVFLHPMAASECL